MKRAMILALLCGGCGIFGDGKPSDPTYDNSPPPDMTDEQERAYKNLDRWIKSPVERDVETYLGLLSAYNRSNLLFNALFENDNQQVLPRAHELPSVYHTEVANWYNFNKRGKASPDWLVTVLPASFRNHEWVQNVLRDHFNSHYDDIRLAWEGSRVDNKTPGQDHEGIMFVVLLNTKRPVIVEMRLEDGDYRVNYVKDSGG